VYSISFTSSQSRTHCALCAPLVPAECPCSADDDDDEAVEEDEAVHAGSGSGNDSEGGGMEREERGGRQLAWPRPILPVMPASASRHDD
jgi:hypothetical protein